MPEQHGFILAEFSLPDQIDQSIAGSPRIDWIQQQAFGFGKQADGFFFVGSQDCITGLAVFICQQDIIRADIYINLQVGCCLEG